MGIASKIHSPNKRFVNLPMCFEVAQAVGVLRRVRLSVVYRGVGVQQGDHIGRESADGGFFAADGG